MLALRIRFIALAAFVLSGCSASQNEHGIGPNGRTTPSRIFHDPGVAALAEAAGTGNLPEIDRLISSGVDVNSLGEDGITPLLWAMLMHNHEGFQRLLERGANPNLKTPKWSHCCSVMGTVAGSQLDDSFYLNTVLEHGGDPNLRDFAGTHGDKEIYSTPLERAALYSRRIENLEMLVRAGADLEPKGADFNATPLTTAATVNWYEGVYYLLQAGADYNHKDDNGATIADYAVDESVPHTDEMNRWKDKVLDFLEEKGVDLAAARKRAEGMGTRTKRWEPGEKYKPKIQEYNGPQYPGYGNK
jgi:hypothetical protein